MHPRVTVVRGTRVRPGPEQCPAGGVHSSERQWVGNEASTGQVGKPGLWGLGVFKGQF